MKKQDIICLIISGVSVLIVLVLWWSGILHLWELKVYDFKFVNRGIIEPSRDIVIVGIDEDSLDIEKGGFGRWPWPKGRSILAKAIDNLNKAGAKVIGIDIIFPEKSQKIEDMTLATVLKKAGNVVGALYFEYISVKTAKNIDGKYVISEETQEKLVLPIKPFLMSFKALGFTNAFPDDDGVLRVAKLVKEYEDKKYYSFNSVIPALALGKNVEEIIPKSDKILVNYHGGNKTYTRYSFKDIYYNVFPENWVKNKIILIGSTATGAYDHYPMPYEKMFPGVELHANVIDNLINKNYIIPCSDILMVLIIISLCVILGRIFHKVKPWISTLIFLFSILVYFIFVQFLFVSKNLHIDFLKPTLGIIFCFSGIMAFRFTVESKEKRWIKKTFSYYLSPQVINELTSNPDKLRLGGEKKFLTILFSDIRGFTTLAEKLAPEEVSSILNEYLSAMTDIIFKYNGTLDKFIGDAIMVLWGAPVSQEDHAKRAVLCAIDMHKKLKELHKEWASQNKPLFEIGIGINSGEVIVGNMGSKDRMEYTAIGDNVNLASRIEGLNRDYNTKIIISESTYELVKNDIKAAPLGEVKVKGKEKPVKIYEVKIGE